MVRVAARSLPRDSHLAPMAVKKKRTESLVLKGGGGFVVFMSVGFRHPRRGVTG